MTALGLAWAGLRARPFSAALYAVLLALGVAGAVALLLFSDQSSRRLDRDADGVHLVIGPKGSPLQLVLAAVFHADLPAGNIPWDAAQRVMADPRVAASAPVLLGDSLGPYRIVGSTPEVFAFYGTEPAQGRRFSAPFEIVLGADVARTLGAGMGDQVAGAHGLGAGGPAHADRPYTVVGLLPRTGSVLDRLALTAMESVWAIHGDHAAAEPGQPPEHDHDHGHDHAHKHDHEADHAAPAASPDAPPREVTAVLLRLRQVFAARMMARQINQTTPLLAAQPPIEITRVFALVGTGASVLQGFALVMIAAAGLSMFATLLAALNDRRGDVALLRAMGATRGTAFAMLLWQGLIIAAVGTLAGIALGHALIEGLARTNAQAAGFGLTGWAVHPGEAAIAAAGLGAGVLAALVPALLAYRTDVAAGLAES